MSKRFLLILSLILFISKSMLFAQDELLENRIVQAKKDTRTFNIQSLEGRTVRVKVLPDYIHNILCVIYLKDTVKVFGYWDVVPKTSYLSKRFIKIDYEVRGGSNFALGNSLIICVSDNKLFEALHVLRYADWESELVKTYNVKFALVDRKKDYVLTASIRDKSISSINPETNYSYTNSSKLHFDRKLKIFYSIKSNLYDTLNVSYHDTTYKQEIQGNFPEAILGDNKYVFIGGQWFELRKGSIIKY
ncbi:hypothetical protein [Mucilaginibacter ginsenosidivorax]|uniref:Uncharacterized protein n=1 Tax=Mucilaginibacter ginsenosidivorax TaxID=862126 RepID=A0A5B8VV68_9SPHI|nr:hypothetical protein [Mucilaginibacter ginsenosidivorax]QEC75021.1 hypothetical protein FSB76_03300 [Mucilaginibacter ginsenosidivorax]